MSLLNIFTIEEIKNISNILFFAVVSVVTVLSYLQARKTLFAPIRTETFKLQLKTFEEILLFFQNKSESDFLKGFDLDRIASLNTLEMADSYVSNFFSNEIKIDKEARSKVMAPLIGAIFTLEHANKYLKTVDAETPVIKLVTEEKKINNPAIILANWQKYEQGMVGFTKEYQTQIKELERLAASPLLPKLLREYIGEFKKIGHENLELIGKTITECAKRMPEHFPNASDMKDFSPDWVWSEFNKKRGNIEPTANKILDYMNNYLKVEELLQ